MIRHLHKNEDFYDVHVRVNKGGLLYAQWTDCGGSSFKIFLSELSDMDLDRVCEALENQIKLVKDFKENRMVFEETTLAVKYGRFGNGETL